MQAFEISIQGVTYNCFRNVAALFVAVVGIVSLPALATGSTDLLPVSSFSKGKPNICISALARDSSAVEAEFTLVLNPSPDNRRPVEIVDTGVQSMVSTAELRSGPEPGVSNAQSYAAIGIHGIRHKLIVVSPFKGNGLEDLIIASDPDSGDLILQWTRHHEVQPHSSTTVQRLRRHQDGSFVLESMGGGHDRGQTLQGTGHSYMYRMIRDGIGAPPRGGAGGFRFVVRYSMQEDGRGILIKGEYFKEYEEYSGWDGFDVTYTQKFDLDHEVSAPFLGPEETIIHLIQKSRPLLRSFDRGPEKYSNSHPDDRIEFDFYVVTSLGRVLDFQFTIGRDSEDTKLIFPRDDRYIDNDPGLHLRLNPVFESEIIP